MHKIALTLLTALSASVAFAGPADLSNAHSASKALRDEQADAAKQAPFGLTQKRLDDEKCLRDMSSPDRQSFEQLPSYECQAWVMIQKLKTQWSTPTPPTREDYQAWHDDVSRTRLVRSKLKGLLSAQQTLASETGAYRRLPSGALPASVQAEADALLKADVRGQLSRIELLVPQLEARNPIKAMAKLVSTVGGAPLAVIRQYIEDQKHV